MPLTVFEGRIALKGDFKLQRVCKIGGVVQNLNVQDVDKRHDL